MTDLLTVGWREWLALPALGLPAIKAKIDTGAKTSALHAFQVDKFARDGRNFVRFLMHPIQQDSNLVVECEAELVDQRQVTDSGGHQELRYVIETPIKLGDLELPIQLTLTNRDSMRFRMLLGRQAMENRILVDPAASFLCGKLDAAILYQR
jgi:hypothetical protein